MGSWGRGVVALGVMLAAVLVCVQSERLRNDTATRKPCGPQCEIYCPLGRVYKNGCPTCTCRKECPLLRCAARLYPCPRGYKKINGCPSCICNLCPLFKCALHCHYGYQTVNGCHICRCKAPICPLIQCPHNINCPHGYEIVNGCRTCHCRAGPLLSEEFYRKFPVS